MVQAAALDDELTARARSEHGAPVLHAALCVGLGKLDQAFEFLDWFQYAACGRHTSVTAGTMFQDTRTPLTAVSRALVGHQREDRRQRPRPPVQLVLGLRSSVTVWTWAHHRPASF